MTNVLTPEQIAEYYKLLKQREEYNKKQGIRNKAFYHTVEGKKKILASQKKYYAKNKDKYKARYKVNREKILEQRRIAYQEKKKKIELIKEHASTNTSGE